MLRIVRPDTGESIGRPSSPWRDIPESDYVGHMDNPSVGQRAVLNQIAQDTFRSTAPSSMLVLGCSTGNGLEHVDPAITTRIVAADINPSFLAVLRARDLRARAALEIRDADIDDFAFEDTAFNLVHAALLLEYVDWRALLPRVARALADGGFFSVVLQRPAASTPAVTPTPFVSLRALERVFGFVDPSELIDRCGQLGLLLVERLLHPLPGDKAFDVMRFQKPRAVHDTSSSATAARRSD